MSIEKKSLISTLKTTKKANVASSAAPEASHVISKKTKMTKKHKMTKRAKVARA
jgi:hypothetical protein